MSWRENRLTPWEIEACFQQGERGFRNGHRPPEDIHRATPRGVAWVAGYYKAKAECLELDLQNLKDEHYLVRKP